MSSLTPPSNSMSLFSGDYLSSFDEEDLMPGTFVEDKQCEEDFADSNPILASHVSIDFDEQEQAYELQVMEEEEKIQELYEKNGYKDFSELVVRSKRVKYKMLSTEKIAELIRNVDKKVVQINQKFEELINKYKNLPISSRDRGAYAIYQELNKAIELKERVSSGTGGMYFTEKLAITPIGEAYSEGYNTKRKADFEAEWVVENCIKTYQEGPRKAAAYLIAKKFGFKHITLPTVLAKINCPSSSTSDSIGFHYPTDYLDPSKYQELKALVNPFYERLCAVQPKVENAQTIFAFGNKVVAENGSKYSGSPEEITDQMRRDIQLALQQVISQHDFMLACIWLLVTGDNDGNLGNFLIYPHTKKSGSGLMKIDEGQTFPEINQGFRNDLIDFLPDFSDTPLDLNLILNCFDLDSNEIASILEEFSLKETISATKVRIETLRAILKEFPKISMRELYYRMSKMHPTAKVFVKEGNPVFNDLTPIEIMEKKIKEVAQRRETKIDFSKIKEMFQQLDTATTKAPKPW